MKPTFFPTPDDFRAWLERHHARADELWVGYYKKATGRPSITWPESVDQALCFGWIDGIRKRIDDVSYAIRFTPRRPGSTWSAVNVGRVRALTEQGHMRPAGLKAFEARQADNSGIYSFEQRGVELPEQYDRLLRKNTAASDFFQAQPASYRKTATWWIVSAKQEATRLRRLERLIAYSAEQQRLPEMSPRRPAGQAKAAPARKKSAPAGAK